MGSEGFDGGSGNPSSHDGWLLYWDRTIHQDDDQSPVLLPHLIGGNIRRDITRPHCLGRARAAGEFDRRKRANGSRDTVFEDGEVRLAQAADGLPLVVEHGHVELDELDAGAKLGQVGLSLSQQHHRRQDLEDDQADSTHTHRYSSRREAAVVCGCWQDGLAGLG